MSRRRSSRGLAAPGGVMRVENCDGRRARTCPCLPAPAVVCAHSNDPMPVSARTYQVLVSQVRVPACVHARASERARGVAHSRCRTYVVPAATTTIRSVPRPAAPVYTHGTGASQQQHRQPTGTQPRYVPWPCVAAPRAVAASCRHMRAPAPCTQARRAADNDDDRRSSQPLQE